MHTSQGPIQDHSLTEKVPWGHLPSPDRGPSCPFVLCLLWPLQHESCITKTFSKRSTRRYPTTGTQPGLCLLSDKHSWNNKTLSERKGSTRRAGLSNFLFWLVASFIRSVSLLAFSPFFLSRALVTSDAPSSVIFTQRVQRCPRARKLFWKALFCSQGWEGLEVFWSL